MTYEEFLSLVEKMRSAQDGFFKSDKNSSARVVFLKKSKALEKMVDNHIKESKSNQIGLFGKSNVDLDDMPYSGLNT